MTDLSATLSAFVKSPMAALIGLPILFVLMAVLFVRDYRRLKRGGAIQYFGQNVYPDDALYPVARLRYLKPYYVFFGLVIFLPIILVGLWLL